MGHMSDRPRPQRPSSVSIPVRLPAALDEQIEEASRVIGLSKQDTMRLSLERGLKVLTAQLLAPQAAA
jgi:hypothetical protein